MTFSFNLIDQRWIPCLRLDGARDELSLHDLLAQAHQLREIRGDSPLETAALHRLLLAVLQRVFGLKDRSGWIKLWEQRSFDVTKLDRYFANWKHRFDLFDTRRPFFQVADESDLGDKDNLNKMVHHVSSGNTATLFEHTLDTQQTGVVCSPAQAARALLTTQYFGLGYQKFVDAPCTKGAIFFLQGDTLFETLVLNLYPASVIESVIPNSSDDTPAWESKDPLHTERTVPLGYLDYLTWYNRKIKFFPENTDHGVVVRQVAWAPGLRLDDGVTDPMQRYWKNDKGGWQEMPFSPERALWQDSAVLLDLSADRSKVRPIAAVEWISRIARTKPELLKKTCRLAAYGMSKYTAKIEFFRAELTPLPIQYLQDDDLVGKLSSALELADRTARELAIATFNLARLILYPRTEDGEMEPTKTIEKMKRRNDDETKRIKPLANSWGTERYFWSGLELHFYRLVQDLPADSPTALKAWRAQLRRAAPAAFKQAEDYAGADRRAQRAIVQARDEFDFGLRHILTEPNEADSTNGGENQ